MSQKYEKLKELLKQLFQLDQPDLDFGIYRILHARSAEITEFLDKTLPPQVAAAFSQYRTADKAVLEKELAQAKEQAAALGVDPALSTKVQELEAKLKETAVDVVGLENEVYDHLYSFFRRYYSDGDFLSKRVYKEGVYAIPYEGEEVKLHWANSDQYYIKTSEYLRDYAFRLRPDDEQQPMPVHFQLVDASEGDHGNIKAAEGKDRVFVLAVEEFIAEEDGELILRFEYRPATTADWLGDSGKGKPPAQKDLIALAVKRVLSVTDGALAPWIAELGREHALSSGEKAGYTKLEAHLRRYTARNTFDYFIHKDLGGFLRRELDFYIKNEVMRLDDIEDETAARVEQYLSKIKVIRRIAGKIIDFLAQVEDFQKRLWVKKKFVVETQYCITLDLIPAAFYPEIAGNDAQREEWVRLFAIDQIQGDLVTPGYSVPLTVEFLVANSKLPLDTRLFSAEFSHRILEAVDTVEEQTVGLLVNGDNFHALRLLERHYGQRIDMVYLDPPYNTGSDGFAYKDAYRHSSWLTMMENRLTVLRPHLQKPNLVFCSIDRDENRNLLPLMFEAFGENGFVEEIVWQKAYGGGSKTKWMNNLHEYVLCFSSAPDSLPYLELPPDPDVSKYYKFTDAKLGTRGKYRLQPLHSNSNDYRENLTYPIPIPEASPSNVADWQAEWNEIRSLLRKGTLLIRREEDQWVVAIRDEHGEKPWHGSAVVPEKQWQWSWERTRNAIIEDAIVVERRGSEWSVNYKQYQFTVDGQERGKKPASLLIGPYTQSGTQEVRDLFGYDAAKFPKPVGMIKNLIGIDLKTRRGTVLDFFAGSGTTAHAVIELNRENDHDRKFVLVELGDAFDAVLKPRVLKALFSPSWLEGRPVERNKGLSGVIKVLRLESYEDTLNNLELRRTQAQQTLLDLAAAQGAGGFNEQYLLRYMLDVESRGSLLNVEAFHDPAAYKLKVKRPGSDESREVNVDLLETFNWLVGLTVRHIAAPQTFQAEFVRDSEERLVLKGDIRLESQGPWWFRKVEGTTPDGRRTLIIWRKLTGDAEKDNLVLDRWFTKQGYSTRDTEFDLIYVNGGNNLSNLQEAGVGLKVRLLEEEFHRLMFETEGV